MNAGVRYGDIVRTGARHLAEAGIDDAYFEARLLMRVITGMSAARWIMSEQDAAPPVIAERYERMIRERMTRRPLQHILGTTEFYGLEFLSDARALIPRSDSETVVEAALDLLTPDRPVLVADLGMGSGCLLAAILANRVEARGVGVEASPDAASLARENLSRLGLDVRATVFEGSWVDWTGWGQVDLVISNPPYIRSALIETLEPEVRHHDPIAALDGGTDGLDAYRELAVLARRKLKPGTPLVLEIGFDQKEDVQEILSGAGMVNIGSCPDLSGNDRVVWAIQPRS